MGKTKTVVLLALIGGMLIAPIGLLLMLGNAQSTVSAGCTVTVGEVPAALGKWTSEQLGNAATIVQTGSSMGVSQRGLTIALMAAMVETNIRNLDYGDRDSLGLFQQRPSAGWGAPEELTDPVYATKAFFGGPEGPNGGSPMGLLDHEGWESMPLGVAAQDVQVSAFPDRYAEREAEATALLAGIGNVSCPTGGSGSAIVDAAAEYLGMPYSWGGGTPEGPSYGIGSGAGIYGFDCSGLAQHAVFKATGVRIADTATPQIKNDVGQLLFRTGPPGSSYEQLLAQLQPGDLVGFSQDGGEFYGHIAIYAGDGQVIHAPRPGKVVTWAPIDYWVNHSWAARRIS